MTVLITLSGVGSSAGPTFNLYASPDGITFTTIVLGINKTVLEAGYTATVPDGTTDIKVTSVGDCTNSYVATIGVTSTTTTTTAPTTTSTTTTAPPEAGITLSVSNDSAALACALYGDPGNEVYYYLDDPIWYISTGLYQDINETLFAPGGFWYCNGVYARLWGGTEFVGLPVEC